MLQLVDEKSYHPLGSNRVAHADIRIIAASNKDLAAETAAGNFRQDLYYRLATFIIEMPPLRTLPEDIPLLAEKFLREACHEIGRAPLEISAAASALLRAHPWPGNIRELHTVIKYAAVMTDDLITPEILHNAISRTDPTAGRLSTGSTAAETPPIGLPLTMAEVEKWALKRALATANGKKMVAARLLDMNYYTFKRDLERHSIDDNLTDRSILAIHNRYPIADQQSPIYLKKPVSFKKIHLALKLQIIFRFLYVGNLARRQTGIFHHPGITETSGSIIMKIKNSLCSLQTADFSQEINFSAKQLLAFKQLRSRAEDLSLALAVRLRVIAKSLAAACRNNQREGDDSFMEHSLTYTLLRHQLNVFLVTHINGEFNAFKPVATVRRHLLTTLPQNLENLHRCRVVPR
ncbi:MAG: sigma 54-interacting transcriptional regulator [Desulfuromonadales bacterium]|nr:sigma 54-interacting transcriptional regulator [Desulfuromonadales bacterium]